MAKPEFALDYFRHSRCLNMTFADGHVEKLRQPRTGLNEGDLHELTKWLCEGKDVSFNGKKYEELK